MPRYQYSTEYAPPAPILPVRIGRPGAALTVFLPALVDTGADLSVLPQGLPTHLELPVVDRLAVAGFDGSPYSLPVYAAGVAIDDFRAIIRVISVGQTPLIGRDVLSKITVHLHGPQALLDLDLPSGTPHS